MKKVKYIVLIFILLLTINVHAEVDHCNKDEFARLKELAKKVEFDYDYKVTDGHAIFSINAINLNKELKVMIEESYIKQIYKEFKNNGNNRGTLGGFETGERVKITIRAHVPNWCTDKLLLTKTIALPYYNRFYNEEDCKGAEDFKYCSLLIDKDIKQSEFKEQLALYWRNKNKTSTNEDNSLVKDNKGLLFIIGGVVLVLIISTLLVINFSKMRKKNSL